MHPKRTRAEWRELITEFECSGESAAAFAAAHDVHPDTLRWWRKQIRKESPVLAPRFIEVALPEPAGSIEVELRNGIRLRLPPPATPRALTELARALGAA